MTVVILDTKMAFALLLALGFFSASLGVCETTTAELLADEALFCDLFASPVFQITEHECRTRVTSEKPKGSICLATDSKRGPTDLR